MVITFVIAAGIAVYTILVLRNKIADIKKGDFVTVIVVCVVWITAIKRDNS